MLTHDIDWFFYAGPFLIHAASNQGILPTEIDEKSNILAQFKISYLPDINEISDVDVNVEYIVGLLQNNESPFASVESYKRTFVMMAQKGLFSFDRNLNNPNEYIWIAKPKKGICEKDAPLPILKLPTNTKVPFSSFKIVKGEIHFEESEKL